MPADVLDIEHEILVWCAGCDLLDVLTVIEQERAGVPHGQKRRQQLLTVLERGEQRTRKLIRHMPEARQAAIWRATWQLRMDVIAACDRCATAERDARWAQDD